jgi:putative peptidoglycan lipid II flippase
MFRKLLNQRSNLLTRPQKTILSAASIIMFMIAASRVLGLIRNRVLAQFFSAERLSVYFAAFRIPEVVFEILVLGTLSAAFIPTFTSYFSRKEKEEAWYVAGVGLNIALLIFVAFAALIFIFAEPLYRLVTPGFSGEQILEVAKLTRALLLTQGFFVASYFLTGILESLKRFLIPAIAPLLYNLGIILGTITLSNKFGLYGPTIGAVIGAFLHFLIQLPLAIHFGFRPQKSLDVKHPGVREIGRLALPKIVELSFIQLNELVELSLATLIATAAYAQYTFANSLQLLPAGLFGTSIAKASLPTLSYLSARGKKTKFLETLVTSFNEINFLVIPCAVFLAVLRIPIVRIVFGAARFSWDSTVQTGKTLSAFALGIFSQSSSYLLARAFYALHDTSTPVKISVSSIIFNIALCLLFVLGLGLPIWSLALAFSLGSLLQTFLLLILLSRKTGNLLIKGISASFLKTLFAAISAGGVMFFFLKILDRSVWSKQLSFLGRLGVTLPTNFERFVFDTRYTINVILLTGLVGLLGAGVYLLLAKILRIKESLVLVKFISRLKPLLSRFRIAKEKEPITTFPSE